MTPALSIYNPLADPALSDDRWEESLDQKTALLIDRDNVDPREHGGKSPEE